MIRIEHNGREWLVKQRDALISTHPTREEAERAAQWLDRNGSRPEDEDDDDADNAPGVA